MRLTWLTLIIVLYAPACAQTSGMITGARTAGMANCSVALTDAATVFNNPGSLARMDASNVYFTYEARPDLPSADRMAAALNIKINQAAFAIGLIRFGDDIYNEQSATAGFSHQIGSTSVGLSATFLQNQASDRSTHTAATFNAGGSTRITPHITVGAFISNITQGKMENQLLPTRMSAGIAINLTPEFIFTSEVEKNLDYPASWRTGAEYLVHRKVSVRTGFQQYPLSGAFGLGLKTGKLVTDYSIVLNKPMGSSFQASATYRFTSSRKKE